MDFSFAYDKYLAYCQKHLKLPSYLDRITIFQQFILPAFGNMKIEDISKIILKDWQSSLESYSYKYKSKIRGYMFNFLKFCEYEFGFENQLKYVWSFKKDKYNKRKQLNIYSQSEYLRLLKNVDDLEYKCIFNLLFLCQLRKGELCALTWDDWKNKKFLDINKTFSRINNYISSDELKKFDGKVLKYYVTGKVVYVLNAPKSPNSFRVVPLPESSMLLLKQLYDLKSQEDSFKGSDYIFGKNNDFLRYTTLSYRFEVYRKKAKLKKIRIHDLRHSGVSYLINTYNGDFAKNSLHLAYIIAERIGDNVDQVLLTYGHLLNNEQQNLVDSIDI